MTEDARERAVVAAGAQAVSRAAGGRDARRLGLILAIAAVVGAAVFTPPGRAVAEWAAELVGIGEVGGPPTSDEHISDFPPRSDRIVFATGMAPNGKPFELVAYRSKAIEGAPDAGPSFCVASQFPEGHGSISDGGSVCYSGGPTESGLSVTGQSVPADGPLRSTVTVNGEATAETKRVVVSYTDPDTGEREETEAALAVLDGKLGKRIGVENPTAFFWAFLPDVVPDGPDSRWNAEVVGYDADGDVVGRSSLSGGRSPVEVAEARELERARNECIEALKELRGEREGQIFLEPDEVPQPCRVMREGFEGVLDR